MGPPVSFVNTGDSHTLIPGRPASEDAEASLDDEPSSRPRSDHESPAIPKKRLAPCRVSGGVEGRYIGQSRFWCQHRQPSFFTIGVARLSALSDRVRSALCLTANKLGREREMRLGPFFPEGGRALIPPRSAGMVRDMDGFASTRMIRDATPVLPRHPRPPE